MWNQDQKVAGTGESKVATVGSSVFIKGEITGSEDLTIDGRIEGRIDLPDHVLTIGPNATIQATVTAKSATIFGSVVGSVKVREKLDIRKSASVEGTVTCARISIQEGAHVSGKVMTEGQRKPAGASADSSAVKPSLGNVA